MIVSGHREWQNTKAPCVVWLRFLTLRFIRDPMGKDLIDNESIQFDHGTLEDLLDANK